MRRPLQTRAGLDSNELAVLFLQWLRPIASTVVGLALILYGALWHDTQQTSIIICGLVVLGSGIAVMPIMLGYLNRVEPLTVLYAQLVIDVVLIAYVVTVLGSPERFTMLYGWGLLFAALLLTPARASIVAAVILTSIAVNIAVLGRPPHFGEMLLQLMFVVVLGVVIAWLRNYERLTRTTLIGTQEQLRFAQRLAHLGSWEWDPSTGKSQWSDELYNLFGIPKTSNPTLATFLNVVVEDERADVASVIHESRINRDTYRFYVTIRRANDGQERIVEIMGTPAPTRRASDTPRYYGSVQDVTQQRHLDQMKSDFVATASHELRTPAAIIIGFAATLRQRWNQLGDGQRQAFVGEIERAGIRLSDLIEDMLQVTRIESGQVRADIEPFDVLSAIRNLLAQWPTTPQPKLRIADSVSAAPGQATVRGDAMRTMQVLSNLLNNAYVHTPKGTDIWVEITHQQHVTRIDVVDTGHGIPSSEHERVFDRFVRLDSVEGGTGLGLYISRRLMEAQGGALYIAQSQAGEGSRFAMELPREMTE